MYNMSVFGKLYCTPLACTGLFYPEEGFLLLWACRVNIFLTVQKICNPLIYAMAILYPHMALWYPQGFHPWGVPLGGLCTLLFGLSALPF